MEYINTPVATSPGSPYRPATTASPQCTPISAVSAAADADAGGQQAPCPAAAASGSSNHTYGTVPLYQIVELCRERRVVEDYFSCLCALFLLRVLSIFASNGLLR